MDSSQTLRARFDSVLWALKAESRRNLDLAIANRPSICRLEAMRQYIPHIVPPSPPSSDPASLEMGLPMPHSEPQPATPMETYTLALLGHCNFQGGFPSGKEDFAFLTELITDLACHPIQDLMCLYRGRDPGTLYTDKRRRKLDRMTADCFTEFINEEACDDSPVDPYLMFWYNVSFPSQI